METFTTIFTQLGADSSIVWQFLIIAIVFIISNGLFLGKLQEVLEIRNEKTTKLDDFADETLSKVKTMQEDYASKLQHASKEALSNSVEQKREISQKYFDEFKVAEKEMEKHLEEKRRQMMISANEAREIYLKQADKLSNQLVDKILQ